jgi:hypothetical protein
LFKGQTELGPNVKSTPVAHMFNLKSLTWRRGPKHPTAILNSGGWTTWDARRRIMWGHSGENGNGFLGFAPDGDNRDGTFGSWTALYPKKIQAADHNALALDPARDIILAIVSATNALYAINPAEPEREIVRLSSIGDQPMISEHAALEYAPNLDRLIYYSANDGPQIFSIAAPPGSSWPELTGGAWRWRSLLHDDRLDPPAHAAAMSAYGVNRNHTYGRFRIASCGETELAVLVRHTDTPVYAMKLK